MGQQIIKQPNKKFALWSSVIDNFILLNATPKEIIEFRIQREKKQIKTNVNYTISQLKQNKKPYYQFTNSWKDCLETIKECHGKQELTKITKKYHDQI